MKALKDQEAADYPDCREAFWQVVSLENMTFREWEALCDHCGRCCLQKLEDEETGRVYYTDVACRLLDIEHCLCRGYQNRFECVPGCLQVTPEKAGNLKWMPETCAYRLLAEGKSLKWWHPLISKDPETVHKAGISVRTWAISEKEVVSDQLEAHVIDMEAFEGR